MHKPEFSVAGPAFAQNADQIVYVYLSYVIFRLILFSRNFVIRSVVPGAAFTAPAAGFGLLCLAKLLGPYVDRMGPPGQILRQSLAAVVIAYIIYTAARSWQRIARAKIRVADVKVSVEPAHAKHVMKRKKICLITEMVSVSCFLGLLYFFL